MNWSQSMSKWLWSPRSTWTTHFSDWLVLPQGSSTSVGPAGDSAWLGQAACLVDLGFAWCSVVARIVCTWDRWLVWSSRIFAHSCFVWCFGFSRWSHIVKWGRRFRRVLGFEERGLVDGGLCWRRAWRCWIDIDRWLVSDRRSDWLACLRTIGSCIN